MPNRDEMHRATDGVPEVGRPRGAAWRSLQADGVVWEGQVLLVGDDVDLAARLIVTHRRAVFVRGGDLVLDVPRGWLRPEPVLRRDGVLDLFVSMPAANPFDEPMRVSMRMREGNAAAGHIIAMLAPGGVRRIAPDTLSGMERAREATPPPRFASFWDDEPPPLPDVKLPGLDDTAPASSRPLPPLEPQDRVVRLSSTPPQPAVNHFSITGLQPRDQRRNTWGLFLRLGALAVLLFTAAAVGAGRLDILPRPAGSAAILAAPTPTVAATIAPTAPNAALAPAEQTAVAIGVGGESAQATDAVEGAPAAALAATPDAATATVPTPAVATAATAPAATEVPAAPAVDASPAAAGESTAVSEASPQSAALPESGSAAQEIVVGPLRLAVTSAQRADTLPAYGLPPGSGNWVVLTLDVRNEGETPASLAMSDLRLFDRGTGNVASLDSGTDVIASLAKFDPARGPADTIALEPGQATRALLLYLLPPGSSDDLAFLAGQASMELAPALALGQTSATARPDLVPAKVVAVRDGSRIDVDIAGTTATVQYLGMQAPAGNACFAAEAKAANEQLVAGQQIWLEREASDRTADGALLRHVWVAPQGSRVLVAERLLQAGTGAAAAPPPDTRYGSWLTASEALARTNSAGMWGVCAQTA
jgi:endonuclease YncB( thermonuclease family)